MIKGLKSVLFIALFIINATAFYADETCDQVLKLFGKSEFDYDTLKRQSVLFNLGGSISSENNLLLGKNGSYAGSSSKYLFEFSPNNEWSSVESATLWGSMNIEEGRFLKFAVNSTFSFEYESIIPAFDLSELYISWKYPLGTLLIGRTTYALNSTLNFAGTLDGVSLEVNVPLLDFRSVLGFSGFTGIFHPSYNDFNITAYDRSFNEQTNLSNMVMVVQLNGQQSRRIFLSTDFDIHYLFFHVNPYFLMQYDISNIALPNFSNTDYTVNTFTLGLLNKIKIFTPLYLYIDLAGVFGMIQDIEYDRTVPVSGFGMQSELRYTFVPNGSTALSFCYAVGTGTEGDDNDDAYDFRTSQDATHKFIYYGSFNGGYVLDPVLTNIHSFGVKLTSKMGRFVSGYLHLFQTLKMYKDVSVSDENADLDEFNLGSEVDGGLLFTLSPSASFGIDTGLFIPENAYSDKTPRMKVGANFGLSF